MIARLIARLRTRIAWACPWCGDVLVARSEGAAYRFHRNHCPRKAIPR